jgi:hypothetical protein
MSKAGGPYERLYILTGKIAAEASLCCSMNHLEELLEWDPYQKAIERAEWLDSLTPLWVKSAERALDGELEWWLRKELGLATSRKYEPFSAAFSGVLGASLTPSQTVGLLGSFGIAGLVRVLHRRRDQLPDVKGNWLAGLRKVHQHRARLPPDADLDKIVEVIRGNRARDLDARARGLVPKLREADQCLSEEAVRSAASAIREEPDAVPLDRLMARVQDHIVHSISAQKRNSAKFRQRHASSGHDIMHLTGAVYCDVFTCDKRIDEAIGGFRTDRGMLPQLSVGRSGGPGPFVERLQQQFDGLLNARSAGAG